MLGFNEVYLILLVILCIFFLLLHNSSYYGCSLGGHGKAKLSPNEANCQNVCRLAQLKYTEMIDPLIVGRDLLQLLLVP